MRSPPSPGDAWLELPDADDVVLGIGDFGDLADVRNVDNSRSQLAAGGFDGRHCLDDRAHTNRAAEAVEGTLRGRAAAFGDEALRDAGICLRTSDDQVQIRRARDFESPTKDALVEPTSPFDIAREDLEMYDGICHVLPSP